ncbi:PIN domain-containing protein [Candidatus Dojkabacteria bacterium]|nr:PIN domain-containing protein [Candidatus Dojkabacteria bacterium]
MVEKRKEKKLATMKKLYADSYFWICAFEGSPYYKRIVHDLLKYCLKKNILLTTSFLSFTECLVLPIRDGNRKLKTDYIEFLTELRIINPIPVDPIISIKAAELRAKYNIMTPDCIHLSTGIQSDCDYFISNDLNLKKVEEIQTIGIKDLVKLIK